MNTYIIAEAGVNHNGKLDTAKELIIAAKNAGANAVKFQSFIPAKLVAPNTGRANYQIQNMPEETSDDQLSMLESLSLSFDDQKELFQFSQKCGIDFLSTAFDEESLNFLIEIIKVKRLKIGSGDLTNLPFLYDHAKSKIDIMLSTGMATYEEIGLSLAILAIGYLDVDKKLLNRLNVLEFLSKHEVKSILYQKVTLLQCTTEYPCPEENANLSVLDYFLQNFPVKIGFSDHTLGSFASLAAVAKGASIIEKHITLKKSMIGPDHKASLEPAEFKELVDNIRRVEIILGSYTSKPTNEEKQNRFFARKSIRAKTTIKIGERLSAVNLEILRPENGISPSQYWSIIGTVAHKDYNRGDLIEEER